MEIREGSVVAVEEVTALALERVPLLDAGVVRSTIDPATTEHLRVWDAREEDGRLAEVAVTGRPATLPPAWRFLRKGTISGNDPAGPVQSSKIEVDMFACVT
jgi:hypothetical protein